jgi:hypothetical protein
MGRRTTSVEKAGFGQQEGAGIPASIPCPSSGRANSSRKRQREGICGMLELQHARDEWLMHAAAHRTGLVRPTQ